ncbi:MAG: recombinase family protein [Hungatella sp.]|nr:recombinase family protein [Hungatella sp.]
MAKNVTTIPATRNRFTAAPISGQKKRRVAGYARVSTDMEDQQTSYAAQCDYYTRYIQSREDWEFVKLYSDEGISATSMRHRGGFNQMVEDALAGHIDLIITKSVSRFARNTVDSLSTIRKLKENGCECYFEKENIWTFDSKGELLITIMSSLAQEESRSISENCTWGIRKRFADGKVSVPFSRFLGYDRGENGNLVINEEQAKTVRKIYGLFLRGHSPYKIAKILTEEGIPTPGGKKVWGKAVVESILTNEKYKGDALLQKVYTVDFLSKKKKVNEGEVPRYYVEGNHPAIIEPDLFDSVQALMKARRPGKNRNSCVSVFSGKIKCGDCGSWYGSKVWHSNDKYRKVVWRCNHKYDGGEKCATPHFDEETIKTLFVRALNIFCGERDEITAVFEEVKETAFRTNGLEEERDRLREEMNVVGELIQQRTAENAGVSRNQADYEERRDTLWERFDKAKARMGEVEDRIVANQAQGEMARKLVDTLKGMPDVVDSFDEGAWYALVDYVTVYGRDDVRFTFKNGVEIKV